MAALKGCLYSQVKHIMLQWTATAQQSWRHLSLFNVYKIMIPVKTGFHLFVIKGHMTSQALYILNEEDEKKKSYPNTS